MFHVDGAPPQSENFASPQAIVGSNFYAQFQRVTRHCVEQGKHLFLAVEATVEHILLGTVYLVGRILEQDILLNRCLKCLSDDCVIMNDRNRKLLKKRYEQKIDAVAAMMDAYVAYKFNRDAFD